MNMKYLKYYLLSLSVVVVDHMVKLLVYFNMELGSIGEIPLIGNWFKLHYTLNPGMAFGLELGWVYGKFFLTFFRIIVMGVIAYLLYNLIKNKKYGVGLYCCIALILGGAVGNIIDSIFYGAILNNAPYNAPTPWFHGQVIDMFYLDIWEGKILGMHLALWPIFNIADSAIFIGVCILIIFQKKLLHKTKKLEPEASPTPENIDQN